MSSELVEKPLTPMMEQWKKCKEQAKEALLLFRMGDFYEAFYEDAEVISRELDVTLTQRQGIPMSGVPWHSSDPYIDKLVAKGFRIAIAEQTEDPKVAKGLVKREVTRFITPGTVINSSLLAEKANRYLVALAQVGSIFGLSFLDLTTGEFQVMECDHLRELLNEIARLRPVEIFLSKKFQEKHADFVKEALSICQGTLTVREDWTFEHKQAYAFLSDHFKTPHLDGFGLKGMVAAVNASGALLAYLKEELSLPISHIRSIRPYTIREALTIDPNTQRHLELLENQTGGNRKQTLLGVIDHTLTPMGGRLLQQWLKLPLLSLDKIQERQDAVEELLAHSARRAEIRRYLERIRDLQRLMMKIETGYATPRDLVGLGQSLEPIFPLKQALEGYQALLIEDWKNHLSDMRPLVDLLKKALVEDPPLRLNEGNIFREGYRPDLDELKQLSQKGKEWIAHYQNTLREELGIKTLRVGFNKVFGYFIEVSKGQAKQMPASFHRRQTLTNAERFISPELKEYEDKVLNAEERMQSMETELFHELRETIAKQAMTVQRIALAVATIDVLQSFAELAQKHNYVRPLVDRSSTLSIKEGRHPVVETTLPYNSFIPNDLSMDGLAERLLLITGPNMGGKSTYLRQIALIVILAQIGSFVPAQKAHIGLIDKIFTRIGASDDLARGQSTFMVEMSETANILHNATDRSLVLLDEIGRGTSTYDGVSIAWAVAEELLTTEGRRPKTLFATHYGELTQLEKSLPGVLNYHAAVEESDGSIIFLHKILRGAADRSYGIHVARLAGMPLSVVLRAQEILQTLEQANREKPKKSLGKSFEKQLSLF